jgi:NAD(P)H-flavin reductase
MAPHVGFGRGLFEDPAVSVDEGQILALKLRKARLRRGLSFAKRPTHFRIHLRLHAEGGAGEYKVLCGP